MNQPILYPAKSKKQRFRKYQYTKPYKDRNREKDFGMGLALKQKRKLKFPQKPHYYTLYTTQKLAPTHPFFNIRNKDFSALVKQVQTAKEEAKRSDTQSGRKSSFQQSSFFRSSLFKSDANSKPQSGKDSHNQSSLGIVTITSKSQKDNPFSRGYSVTTGPKVYRQISKNSQTDLSFSMNTPVNSLMSHKNDSKGQQISELLLNDIYSCSAKSQV